MDLYNEAIDFARELSTDLNIPVDFVCCNLYDLPLHLKGQFDIIFTSYGVVGWLPDLDKWADVINKFLKPGGSFFIADFHPVVWMMDENFEHIIYFYHNEQVIKEEMRGT